MKCGEGERGEGSTEETRLVRGAGSVSRKSEVEAEVQRVKKSQLDKETRGRVFKAEETACAKVLRQRGIRSVLLILLEAIE